MTDANRDIKICLELESRVLKINWRLLWFKDMNYIHKRFFKYVYITLNWCQFRVSLINTNLHFVSVEFWWYNKTRNTQM